MAGEVRMDSSTFDRLARRLVAPATRGSAVAALDVFLTRFLLGGAAAQPRTTCRALGQVCIPELSGVSRAARSVGGQAGGGIVVEDGEPHLLRNDSRVVANRA